ncbi:MAG TPA: beta-ketoacyl-[acyl-carrier-protein] synthase family protein [Steroidobacteraceae bacterium]|nr:beta-ketoacyl-[acyl-carrier-protein] synthase family protein [Steroidobacteraceae bacterium]
MRRVAVTGIGVLSPLGNTAADAFENAAAGRSAIRRLEEPWATRLSTPIAASVKFEAEAHFEAPRLRMLDRVSQLAVVAARQAMTEARAAEAGVGPDRMGVFLGTGMGAARTTDDGYRACYGSGPERINPFAVLMGMNNAAAAWVGAEFGITGPNLTYSTACSSAAVAIGEAWGRVARGDLDVAIAGGAEAPLTYGALKAWESLHTLAREDPADVSASCKPFAGNRCGMVLAEGAALFVLEDLDRAAARGAPIRGELTGFGLATDLAHITRPSVGGQVAAMQAALRSARARAEEIDHINAHGTGTQANDGVESAAIKEVFGERAHAIPVSATKSMHGHLLGATGALELALSLLTLERGVLLPTMHLKVPAPDCDLDYVPNAARHGVRVRTVMSSSFAFGGTNAVLIARAA